MTSKQRAYLRGLANTAETILIIGKDGVTDNVLKQADDAIEAREIIKLKCLETSMMTPREAAEEIAAEIKAEVVQVIGSKAQRSYRRDESVLRSGKTRPTYNHAHGNAAA